MAVMVIAPNCGCSEFPGLPVPQVYCHFYFVHVLKMPLSLHDIVSAEELRLFYSDASVAHGLPAFAYTDPDYWQLENQRLLSDHWVFAGFAHQIPDPGDVRPVTIGGKPVFMIRNQNGQINVFHNACRHRCLKLIDVPGNTGPRIRCPYHSWVYNLDGKLKSTPYLGGPDKHSADGFNPDEHGLVPVHSETWHDWIFINLSEEPEDFQQHVAPLASRLSDLDLNQIVPVALLEFGVVETNWKLLMENFIEPYHVQFVHSSTTDQPLKDHYTVIDGHCLGSAVDISEPASNINRNTLAVNSLYLTLFPNFVFGRYYPDQIGVHLNIPVAVDKTLQQRVIYITDGEKRSDTQVDALRSLWHDVHKEDHAMCERMQQGKSSVVADQGGRLSPHWEDSVKRFQQLALAAVS